MQQDIGLSARAEERFRRTSEILGGSTGRYEHKNQLHDTRLPLITVLHLHGRMIRSSYSWCCTRGQSCRVTASPIAQSVWLTTEARSY